MRIEVWIQTQIKTDRRTDRQTDRQTDRESVQGLGKYILVYTYFEAFCPRGPSLRKLEVEEEAQELCGSKTWSPRCGHPWFPKDASNSCRHLGFRLKGQGPGV